MVYSTLCTGHIDTPNKRERTAKIERIIIHHFGVYPSPTAKEQARRFSDAKRGASSNYCIGSDGEIWGSCPEDYRSICSSNWQADNKAITIEVANSSGAPSWAVSDKAYISLINLCRDICERYNIDLNFTGDKNGTLTFHAMYSATECCGRYLKDRMPDIVKDVKSGRVDTTTPVVNVSRETFEPYRVKVTCNCLNIRKAPTTNSAVVGQIKDKGVYTIIEQVNNWGALKSGIGYICLDYTKKL